MKSRSTRAILAAVFLALGLRAQPPNTGTPGELVRFVNVFQAITTAQTSGNMPQIGQGMHVVYVRFPTAVADVTPIQVRILASYNGTNFFPISRDITTARRVGAPTSQTWAFEKANGVFPFIRVDSAVAVPGGVGSMDVYYTGSPYPVSAVTFTGDRFLFGPEGVGYDKVTFVVCNGAPCTVGANLTNEYIVVESLTFRTCYAFAKTAPTGAALIFDINRNGSSIWTAGQRLQIPAGASTVQQVSAFTTATVNATDRLTIDIDQIGSIVAGQDVTITCVLDF